MADLNVAFPKTMENEGGFVLHKVVGDNGGLTFAGIAENFHPDWEGWSIVKQFGESDPRLTSMVRSFYKKKFWDVMCGDDICDQETAESIFDFGVNAGIRTSIKLTQGMLGLVADGVVGPVTLNALNKLNGKEFEVQFFAVKMARYASIVRYNRSQDKFLYGWLVRSLKALQS